MEECTRKTIFGWPACRFEARYDNGPVELEDSSDLIWVRRSERVDALEKYRTQTYVRDICTKCGKTIERLTP